MVASVSGSRLSVKEDDWQYRKDDNIINEQCSYTELLHNYNNYYNKVMQSNKKHPIWKLSAINMRMGLIEASSSLCCLSAD